MKVALVLVIAFAVAALASNTENKKQIKLPSDSFVPEGSDEFRPVPDQMERRGDKGKGGSSQQQGWGWGPPPMPMGWGWGQPMGWGMGGGYGGGYMG